MSTHTSIYRNWSGWGTLYIVARTANRRGKSKVPSDGHPTLKAGHSNWLKVLRNSGSGDGPPYPRARRLKSEKFLSKQSRGDPGTDSCWPILMRSISTGEKKQVTQINNVTNRAQSLTHGLDIHTANQPLSLPGLRPTLTYFAAQIPTQRDVELHENRNQQTNATLPLGASLRLPRASSPWKPSG